MSAAAKKRDRSNATLVGGAGGIGVAALAIRIQDQMYRDLFTVAAPVTTLILCSAFDVTVEVVRNLYRNATQRWHERTATSYAKKVLADPASSEEAKARAARAIANAQIATIEYHEKNLKLVSQVNLNEVRQRNRKASEQNAGR